MKTWFRYVRRIRRDGTARKTSNDFIESGRGRFNQAAEDPPTCYGADSVETAFREVSVYFGSARVNLSGWALVRMTVSPKARLLDMRKKTNQSEHGITDADLHADPWPPRCEEVATKLRAAGFHGIIFGSVRSQPTGVCVAMFLEHASRLIKVDVVSEEKQEMP